MLDIIQGQCLLFKHDVSKIGLCLRIGAEARSIYWAQLSKFHLKTEQNLVSETYRFQ
jgi:hypothetical protein